ncbi:MAG: hypothetical protein HQ532_02845 [Candidatus Omnitrophica bacterium]|nr:hypothetical protein [Candidatus Omnitrophota bacterium]
MHKVAALLKVIYEDKRYDPESYSFVMASLDFTSKKLRRRGHVSGQELLEGIREYAIEQFGPMARPVLEHWGIKSTGDFGEIVFNMIDVGLLGKTDQDSKQDFSDTYDFKTAFDKDFKYTLL